MSSRSNNSNSGKADVNWKPRPARPGGKWSHTTLIVETRRYIDARRESLNPPLLPEPPVKRVTPELRPEPLPGLKVLRQPSAERRKKTRPEVAFTLLLGGGGVLFLDVLSLRDVPDATFYLSFVFGLVLLVQGLRLLLRVRW